LYLVEILVSSVDKRVDKPFTFEILIAFEGKLIELLTFNVDEFNVLPPVMFVLKPSTVALTEFGTILQEFIYICCFDA
jgi:hypothetical protein